MKKQIHDVAWILSVLITFWYVVGIIVFLPFYGLAFLLGHGYPFSTYLLGIAFYVFIGVMVVSFPFMLWQTRRLTKDPFRFSPVLKAYFRVPETMDVAQLTNMLQSSFTDIREETQKKFEAVWERAVLQDGQQTYTEKLNRRTLAQRRLIRIEFLGGWQGFKEQRVEVSIEVCAPIKLYNDQGLNQFVLQVLMNTLGWGHYRIPMDVQGHPQW